MGFTCNPKPYKIVGYDSLIIGSNPENSRFLDSQVGFRVYLKRQIAQIGRLPYPKVAHNWLKVAPKCRLPAFQEGLRADFFCRTSQPRGLETVEAQSLSSGDRDMLGKHEVGYSFEFGFGV